MCVLAQRVGVRGFLPVSWGTWRRAGGRSSAGRVRLEEVRTDEPLTPTGPRLLSGGFGLEAWRAGAIEPGRSRARAGLGNSPARLEGSTAEIRASLVAPSLVGGYGPLPARPVVAAPFPRSLPPCFLSSSPSPSLPPLLTSRPTSPAPPSYVFPSAEP